MVKLENLKRVDFGNLSKEEREKIRKEAKEWSKIFERVYATSCQQRTLRSQSCACKNRKREWLGRSQVTKRCYL